MKNIRPIGIFSCFLLATVPVFAGNPYGLEAAIDRASDHCQEVALEVNRPDHPLGAAVEMASVEMADGLSFLKQDPLATVNLAAPADSGEVLVAELELSVSINDLFLDFDGDYMCGHHAPNGEIPYVLDWIPYVDDLQPLLMLPYFEFEIFEALTKEEETTETLFITSCCMCCNYAPLFDPGGIYFDKLQHHFYSERYFLTSKEIHPEFGNANMTRSFPGPNEDKPSEFIFLDQEAIRAKAEWALPVDLIGRRIV